MITGNPVASAGRESGEKKREPERIERREDELDLALEDTFPASDPPAMVAKGTISNPKPHEKKALRK